MGRLPHPGDALRAAALPADPLMEPLLVFPEPTPVPLITGLDRAGYPWKAVNSQTDLSHVQPEDGWSGAVVCAEDDADGAFALCRTLRKRDLPLEPLLLVLAENQLDDLQLREDLFDDFVVSPFRPHELDARLKHLFWRTGTGTR